MGEVLEFPGGSCLEAVGDQCDGEGESAAEFDDVAGSGGFGVDALGSDDVGEECFGVGGAEDVEGEGVGAVEGECSAAGDEDEVGCPGWEEGLDLFGCGGVVEQYQCVLAVEAVAVEGGPAVEVLRD
ncbi:hypothetical protein, partial [Prauserella marina]|uniref:hypothetical protein n=1 Tax=Prauserella marina TaxID=530584 RepID=UPI0014740712